MDLNKQHRLEFENILANSVSNSMFFFSVKFCQCQQQQQQENKDELN